MVTHDVAAYSIVAGVPARKLRDRFAPELIKHIEASRWWELNLAQLRDFVRDYPEMFYHPTADRLEAWLSTRS